jgi:hypothetical protein
MTDKTAKPKWLKELQSIILTRLPSPAEKEAWRQALYSAIPSGLPGEVLTRIRDRFLRDLLVKKVRPLVPENYATTRDAISGVVDLLNRSIKGEPIINQQWRQAATAARSAARSAARFAVDAATWHAADAAAQAAKWAAWAAAWNAADAAARAGEAAAAAFWQWAAEHLLALIKEERDAWEMARKPA